MRLDRPRTACAVLLLVAIGAVALVDPLSRIALRLDQPNEGWNAVHALRWLAGGPLYPPRDAWIVNNYPPLWFMLEAWLAAWLGDAILAGRAVALAAFAATAALIAAAVRALGGDRLAAAAAAAFFVAGSAAAFGAWVGLAEPQMLAHALMMAGLVVLLRARGRGAVAAAALLMVLGGLAKPNVFAVPLAATLWLARYRRTLLGSWLAAAIGLAGLAVAVLLAAFGGDLVAGMTYPRIFSLTHVATSLAHASKAAVALAAWAALAWRARGRRDDAVALVGLLILAAFIEIAAAGGALGVSGNVAFDLMIAAALAVGIAVARIAATPDRQWRGVRLRGDTVAALFVVLLALRAAASLTKEDLTPFAAAARGQREAAIEESAGLRARIAAIRGPIACEALSLCAWAGHLSDIDLWKLRHELTLSPTVDARAVVARIARGDYAAVVLYGRVDSAAADGNLPGLYQALAAAYPGRMIGGNLSLFWR